MKPRSSGPYRELTDRAPASAPQLSSDVQEGSMSPKTKMNRTLALVLAGGSLAIGVPAALAAGGGDG
jgi:hypothetical protein